MYHDLRSSTLSEHIVGVCYVASFANQKKNAVLLQPEQSIAKARWGCTVTKIGYQPNLVGGLEHIILYSHILGIIIPLN